MKALKTPDRLPTLDRLIERLDLAVELGDPASITARIKSDLEQCAAPERLQLPQRFRAPGPESYARRLLHRDPQMRYTCVLMTWGPGQGTSLHDHAGMWCVECVVDGEMKVNQYDLVEQREDRYRFTSRGAVRAGVGSAGCLIPPYEYHVLANASQSRTSLTLHVYSGEMEHCHLFHPADAGWWIRETRRLGYDD